MSRKGGPLVDVGDRVVDLRLLPGALTAWVATAATLGVAATWRIAAAVLLVLLVVPTLWLAGRRPGRTSAPRGVAAALALAVMATALCLGAAGAQAMVRDAGSVRALADSGAVVRVEAMVVSDPRTLAASPRAGGRELVLVRLAVSSIEGRGERSLVRSRVLVFADARWARLHWGERLSTIGRLAPARVGDDVTATLSARGPPVILAGASRVDRAAERLRAGLRTAAKGLAPDPRGLLPGLVVGDTSLQPPDLVDDMRATTCGRRD